MAVATRLYGDKLDGESAELGYLIEGTTDSGDARDELLSEAPATYEGLTRRPSTARVTEMPNELGYWMGRVQYGRITPTRAGGVDLGIGEVSVASFTSRGGTTRIYQSLSTVNSYSVYGAGLAPDFGGLIGVDRDGNPQGVDVPTSAFEFTLRKRYASSSITNTWINTTLPTKSGKCNDATVNVSTDYPSLSLSFGEGTLLFYGADIGNVDPDIVDVDYSFAASPNLTGITVGGMTGIDKDGWDYLWVKEGQYEDNAQQAVKPIAAYVERVIERVSFTGIIL